MAARPRTRSAKVVPDLDPPARDRFARGVLKLYCITMISGDPLVVPLRVMADRLMSKELRSSTGKIAWRLGGRTVARNIKAIKQAPTSSEVPERRLALWKRTLVVYPKISQKAEEITTGKVFVCAERGQQLLALDLSKLPAIGRGLFLWVMKSMFTDLPELYAQWLVLVERAGLKDLFIPPPVRIDPDVIFLDSVVPGLRLLIGEYAISEPTDEEITAKLLA